MAGPGWEVPPGLQEGTLTPRGPEHAACSRLTPAAGACRQGCHGCAGAGSLKRLLVGSAGGRDTGGIEGGGCPALPAGGGGWPAPARPLAAPTSQAPVKRLVCNAARSRQLREDEGRSTRFCSSQKRAASALTLLHPLLTLPHHPGTASHLSGVPSPDFLALAQPQPLGAVLPLCSGRPPPPGPAQSGCWAPPALSALPRPRDRAERDPAPLGGGGSSGRAPALPGPPH